LLKLIKRVFFITLIVLPALLSAQSDIVNQTNINRKGSSFSLGSEFLAGENEIYFNASGEGRGSQLYHYDGDRHLRLTSFFDSYLNAEIKEKEQSPIPLGAITSQYKYFGDKLFFYAKGEMTPGGLYYYHKGLVSSVFKCAQIGKVSTEFNGKLLLEVELGEEHRIGNESKDDSVGKRVVIFQIGMNGKASLFARGKGKYQSCFADNIVSFNGELFIVKSGRLYSTKGNRIFEDPRFQNYKNVGDLFLFDDKLYFSGIENGTTTLVSYDKNGVFRDHGNVVPNHEILNSIEPVVLSDKVFFVSRSESNGVSLYKLEKNKKAVEFRSLEFSNGGAHVESLISASNQLFATLRTAGENYFNLYQINRDTTLDLDVTDVFDIRDLCLFKGELYFSALSKKDGRELYSISPKVPPKVRDHHFVISDYNKSGFKIGTIEVANKGQRGLEFEIISGNGAGIFKLAEHTGVLSIERANRIDASKQKRYFLKVKVSNRDISSYLNVTIDIKRSVQFSFDGLEEKLLFFPDFSRKGVLTAGNVEDGTVVNVYTLSQEMIDQLVVRDGSIQLGTYPTGIYILNIVGENNYYQRIEMQ